MAFGDEALIFSQVFEHLGSSIPAILKSGEICGLAAHSAGSTAERYDRVVTAKEEHDVLINRLAGEQAQGPLDDLRGAADVNGPPLNEEAMASLDRGLADIASNWVVSLEDFERKHPL